MQGRGHIQNKNDDDEMDQVVVAETGGRGQADDAETELDLGAVQTDGTQHESPVPFRENPVLQNPVLNQTATIDLDSVDFTTSEC